MVFNIIIILIVAAVAYFHWVQGLFSGIISLALALCGSALAIGLNESLNASLLGGKMADSAAAIVICIVFTAVYGLGRVAFDSLIPGNVRLPLYVDRVGGGACGLAVGVFVAGTFAIAAQTLPVGPEVWYYSRYPIAETKSVRVAKPGYRDVDADVSGALEDDLPPPEKEQALYVTADSMLASFAGFQSESGALAGGTSFRQVHPDLLRELFFARSGIEPGAKHTALNIGGKSEVGVTALFAPASLPQMDGELTELQRNRKLPAKLDAKQNQLILIVRTTVKSTASDSDHNFRFSCGMVRLVSNGKTYFPIGTMYGAAQVVLNNRIDDYLIAKADDQATIDLVFLVDRTDVLADAGAKDGLKLKADAFVEMKRYGRVDLTGKEVATRVPDLVQGNGVLRKKGLVEQIAKRFAVEGGTEAGN